LARSFTDAGFIVVEWGKDADVLVVNTCTVTAAADAKARQVLRAAHRTNRGALIVATGCYAERAADQLAKLEGVSLVVGNRDKEQLVAQVTAALTQQETDRTLGHQGPMLPSLELGLGLSDPGAGAGPPVGRSRAMIKIQEGCDQVCAYCIVPKVRGRERSIPAPTVVEQINRRVEQGCQEVVLTGTQLGSYGFDIPGASLPDLLDCILRDTPVPRLRVSSVQAQEFSPELLERWENPRLCPHFHIPLQSGCDKILASMRRRYDTSQFAKTVAEVRRRYPDAGITTDLIVGFPGEGEREYQESRCFALAMELSDMHVFPYSVRPGTSAAYLEPKTKEAVKKQRAVEMINEAKQGFQKFRLGQLGRTRPVLWEAKRTAGPIPLWSGLTDNYIRVTAQDQRELRNRITQGQLLKLAEDEVISRAW
jgi:threonylcarbamoyladenosine tRNA methylthiotransferase MtaB